MYVLTEEDFYIPGKKTILNNERAALVYAEKLYRSLNKGEEYMDDEFGPKDDNDEEGH